MIVTMELGLQPERWLYWRSFMPTQAPYILRSSFPSIIYIFQFSSPIASTYITRPRERTPEAVMSINSLSLADTRDQVNNLNHLHMIEQSMYQMLWGSTPTTYDAFQNTSTPYLHHSDLMPLQSIDAIFASAQAMVGSSYKILSLNIWREESNRKMALPPQLRRSTYPIVLASSALIQTSAMRLFPPNPITISKRWVCIFLVVNQANRWQYPAATDKIKLPNRTSGCSNYVRFRRGWMLAWKS